MSLSTNIDLCDAAGIESPVVVSEGVIDAETLRKKIKEAVEERDLYWREQIREADGAQRRRAADEAREMLRKRLCELQKIEKVKQDQLVDAKEALEKTVTQYEEEITRLKAQTVELRTEVEAGKHIIHQFSQLMKDKASSVCQYCRRSGTLPPIPSR